MVSSRPATSVSRRNALTSLRAGGITLAMPGERPASAHTQLPTHAHPIVGAWQWHNNPETELAGGALALFHGDGTYAEFDPAINAGVGAWRPTGERSADLTIIFRDNAFDPNLCAPGSTTFRLSIKVDAFARTIDAIGEFDLLDSEGNVTMTLPYAGQAIRVMSAVSPRLHTAEA